MALDKVVDSTWLDAGMTFAANAIRAKTGNTDLLVWPEGFKAAINGNGNFETGEISGDGITHNENNPLQIPISFKPAFIFICLSDISETFDTNHMVAGTLIRDTLYQMSYRAANAAAAVNAGFGYWCDGLYGNVYNQAMYIDGVLNWLLNPGSRAFQIGASYTWIARKW